MYLFIYIVELPSGIIQVKTKYYIASSRVDGMICGVSDFDTKYISRHKISMAIIARGNLLPQG